MNNGKRRTILIVEDDMHLMEGIREILDIKGYNVLTATNGVNGLEVLKAQPQPPDLIVSDIMMPRMNGYEFYDAVREQSHWIRIPFIFLTAKGEREDIRRGKDLGADDYVVKPFDAEDLLSAVSARLRRAEELFAETENDIAKIKRSILTILNHELRTPLTYVVAYADMLNRDADDLSTTDMRGFLRGINTGANRLRRMVENFILLVELDTGEVKQTFDWRCRVITNYDRLLRSVQMKYDDMAREQDLNLYVEVEPGLPPIRADQEYLTAALECLLDNAIKFSDQDRPPDQARVDLRAYRQGDQVVIEVQDYGRGIPPGDLEKIWKMFEQVNREKYEQQGAGAGLPIVQGITQLHGGTVMVHSEENVGSTFGISLPIHQDEDQA